MSREILSPLVQRMSQNRCYRVNLVHEDFGSEMSAKQQNKQQKPANYQEKDLYGEDDNDDNDDIDAAFVIEELPNAIFKLSMHVPTAFYGGLIGFKGNTKRRIETETQTDINIPRNRVGNRTEDVIIKGKSRSNVCSAQRKIKLLINSLRTRMRPTHFLCIPLNYGTIKEQYNEFMKQVLDANLPGIDAALFQSDICIHLTLNTCVLLDDDERTKAVKLLESCGDLLTDLKTPFQIHVKGLEIFNDDPSTVRVLYACIDAPDLQKFANRIYQRFMQSGFCNKEHGRDDVKLHMTVMNCKFDKDAQQRSKFDAREILKRFANFDFGTTQQCSELQLCVLGSRGVERKEFYKISGALKF